MCGFDFDLCCAQKLKAVPKRYHHEIECSRDDDVIPMRTFFYCDLFMTFCLELVFPLLPMKSSSFTHAHHSHLQLGLCVCTFWSRSTTWVLDVEGTFGRPGGSSCVLTCSGGRLLIRSAKYCFGDCTLFKIPRITEKTM